MHSITDVLLGRWFWCAVTALPESTIRSYFTQTTVAENGCYVLNIPSGKGDGQKVSVTIDDYIPCMNKRPAYGRAGGRKEFWSMLLSKAFAKAQGSFSKLFELPSGSELDYLTSTLDQGDPVLRR